LRSTKEKGFALKPTKGLRPLESLGWDREFLRIKVNRFPKDEVLWWV